MFSLILLILFIVPNKFSIVADILENSPLFKYSLQNLVPGWTFLSRDKDVSDAEWSSWKFYIQTSWFYLMFQFLVSELLRKIKPSLVKYWYILSSLIFVTVFMSWSQMLVIISQPIIYSIIIIVLGGKRISIWITSIALLSTYNSLKYKHYFWQFLDHGNLHDEEVYLLLFAVAWIELRCISFCLDFVETIERNEKNQIKSKTKSQIQLPSQLNIIVDMFSYVLYLPLLYVGPIMLYEDFESSFKHENQVKLIPRLKRFAVDMTLFLFYTFLMDLSLHYMYFYAMQENMEVSNIITKNYGQRKIDCYKID